MESVYRAYKDSCELFADIAEIIRQEASDPATMGCVYIQIDAPELAVLIDPAAHPPRNATLRTEDPRPHHLKLYFARELTEKVNVLIDSLAAKFALRRLDADG